MQDIFGSVRRSLVFRPPDGGSDAGTLADKINSCIRKSKVFARASPPPPPPPTSPPPPLIRWRKGELIGCGAFGQVYMGMNLDSGELLAVKQVLIPSNDASKEKSQLHIRELEEEVKLLKNLSHPNIVRYLGTVREENTLNILLEFVPGGSISSLLGKFGPFPEPVIRRYTKQLLLGLDYLHKNGIMHRDIKGANILVDNKGCIKLADFGASKQVVELATMSGTKSMKGTPYWMAPEVILQTGHSFSADIWSVGCTVIEMATGKPPWSQQYQEVAALFYIGTTKSHPPIPEHLSHGAKDLLLKCLHKEPELRPSACELLQHPFVTGESMQLLELGCTSTKENIETPPSCGNILETCPGSIDMCNLGTVNFSIVNPEKIMESKRNWGADNSNDDMCKVDDEDDLFLDGGANLRSVSMHHDFNKSFNPMEESTSGETHELEERQTTLDDVQPTNIPADSLSLPSNSCASPSISEDDDEVTESKIIAFLDEKALELKRLQTPLYEEFYNSINPFCSPNIIENTGSGGAPSYLKLPPKSKSPNRFPPETPYKPVDAVSNASPGSGSRLISNASGGSTQSPREVSSPSSNPGVSFSEVQRKWKEELDRELETKREMMRQVGMGGKTSSPIDRGPNRRSRFASPGK